MVKIQLSWEEANRAYLTQALQPIKQALAKKAETTSLATENSFQLESEYFQTEQAITFALEELCLSFRPLTQFIPQP